MIFFPHSCHLTKNTDIINVHFALRFQFTLHREVPFKPSKSRHMEKQSEIHTLCVFHSFLWYLQVLHTIVCTAWEPKQEVKQRLVGSLTRDWIMFMLVPCCSLQLPVSLLNLSRSSVGKTF